MAIASPLIQNKNKKTDFELPENRGARLFRNLAFRFLRLRVHRQRPAKPSNTFPREIRATEMEANSTSTSVLHVAGVSNRARISFTRKSSGARFPPRAPASAIIHRVPVFRNFDR